MRTKSEMVASKGVFNDHIFFTGNMVRHREYELVVLVNSVCADDPSIFNGQIVHDVDNNLIGSYGAEWHKSDFEQCYDTIILKPLQQS